MAFTGRALYDTGVWTGVAEDVSDIITSISPVATPLLAALGASNMPSKSILHEWLEEELTPNTIVSSGTMVNSTSETSIPVHSNGAAVASYLQVGAVVRNNTTGEYMQITAAAGNTITVSRAFGATTIATVMGGHTFTVIAPAALEGADVDNDISRPRSRLTNYCQIFKADVVVSGSVQAVSNIGVEDEFEHQKTNRLKEMLRDLEKAVILGKSSGNTIGTASAYRTMQGLWQSITTNATSIGTLTQSYLDDVIQNAWGYGAEDLDLIVADASWKRVIDSWNSSRTQVSNQDETYHNRVTYYESTFGSMPVVLSRWMPTKSLMVVSTNRVKVVPLQGRSFQFMEIGKTGDSRKGFAVGEYTLEVRNEQGLAKAYG
jgi:hypothetical protein